ncbi:MAG: UDP-N-acetylmuramate--alanine ligase [Armatimonadetes bacterium]|nr:UDP-N-acetylmuramate--alanine ligase [Armatimonadota bacterium]
MGSVAAACRTLGDRVAGSEEKLYEPMKSYLERNEVQVFPGFSPQQLNTFRPSKIVVGNAVSRGNEELEFALENRYEIVSLPQLVGSKLIAMNTSMVVTGTHGKTTTTSMLAWILEVAMLRPGFMIGGVPGNFENSCRPCDRELHNTSRGYFVIEGDEYDSAYWDKRSKFLHYRPDVGIINNIEFDHADIFDSLEEIIKSFRLFARLVPRNGLLILNGDDPNVMGLIPSLVSPYVTFGKSESCDWRLVDLDASASGNRFHVVGPEGIELKLESEAQGEYNALNWIAAIAAAKFIGIPSAVIKSAVRSYKLPRRRLEVIGSYLGNVVVDDFAHHPTAIRQTLAALRQRFPTQRIWVAFEPRSNTTTRNLLQKELESCFEGAAGVLIGALDRPERYAEADRLNTDALVRRLESQGMNAFALSIEEGKLPDWGRILQAKLDSWIGEGDVIAILTNGDMGGLRQFLTVPDSNE